jgi:hypothetical protein
MTVYDGFLEFLDFGSKLPNSNSVDNFPSLDTPWDLEGVKVVELLVFEKYFSWFLDSGAAW